MNKKADIAAHIFLLIKKSIGILFKLFFFILGAMILIGVGMFVFRFLPVFVGLAVIILVISVLSTSKKLW